MRDSGDRYAHLFDALPTPHLAVTPNWHVFDANPAYLDLFGSSRDDVVGKSIVALFPASPGSADADGTPFVLLSFMQAAQERRPDPMPVARYDIADRVTGEVAERYWSHVAVPVLDGDEVVLVVQVLTEVTDYVLAQQVDRVAAGTEWRARAEAVEAQLLARAGEVRAAQAAEQEALALRAALAEAALGMAAAQDLGTLNTAVLARGLATVGAAVTSLRVREGDVLRLTVTPGAPAVAQEFREVPLSSPLISIVAARHGTPVLLPDLVAAAAFDPQTAAVMRAAGMQAAAAVPLLPAGEPLGALTFTWERSRAFSPGDVAVLTALAAQCAQALVRIQATQAERARTTQALQMSEALQRSLLTEPTQHAGCTVTARYRPAGLLAQIGGDWFDSFAASAGLAHVVVGDVSGHDQDAAALMGQARNLLRGIAYTIGEPPAAVVRQLDRAMADLGTGVYATLLLACLDRPDAHGARRVRWTKRRSPCSARRAVRWGHRGTGHPSRADARSRPGRPPQGPRNRPAAGRDPAAVHRGLVERRGSDLDLGLDWLVDTVAAPAGAGLQGAGLCDHLLDLVADRAEDDIALLALQVDPVTADPRAGSDRTDLWQPAATPPVPAPARQWPLTDLRGLAEVRRSARRLLLETAVPAGSTTPADPDAVEDTVAQAVLVIDELASNALRHGRPPTRAWPSRGALVRTPAGGRRLRYGRTEMSPNPATTHRGDHPWPGHSSSSQGSSRPHSPSR